MAILITDQASNAQSKTTGSTLGGASGVTNTADTIVVVAACLANATAPTCSDTKGNTYIQVTTLPFNTSADSVCVFYCQNSIAMSGDTVTVDFGVSSTARCLNIWAVSFLGGTFQTTDANVSATGSVSTPSLASGTLKNAAEAVFGIFGINRATGGTFTIDTANGWAVTGSQFGTSGGVATTNISICAEWQVVAATTSRTCAPTLTAVPWGQIVFSFYGPSEFIFVGWEVHPERSIRKAVGY